MFVELLPEREIMLMWSVTQEHIRNTKRVDELRSDRHDHIDEHEIALVHTRQ